MTCSSSFIAVSLLGAGSYYKEYLVLLKRLQGKSHLAAAGGACDNHGPGGAMTMPAALLRFLSSRPGTRIRRIRSEASRRTFFRLYRGGGTRVAMVYPEAAPEEVGRFCAVQKIYRENGLRVPRIDRVIDEQVVILEDAGDLLLQRAWRFAGPCERSRLLGQCREILAGLAAVPPSLAPARLDAARRKWEMDFFGDHFLPHFPARAMDPGGLRPALRRLAAAAGPEDTFAHRDFHSRNLLVLGGEIVMVDFQDSLLAPRYYDLVSLAFDSYLDLGAARGALCPNLAAAGDDRELRRLRLTALQRNVKALGTFAYQAFVRRHPVYARYIPRTLRHIRGHLQVLSEPEFGVLSRYFNSIEG
jgi:aminoglycoside/choline kinase family phosphotransferase